MRAIGNGIGIPFRRNTGQDVIWPPDLKSALVCWYSPRKQKLTEYDVIESYTEDFTTWRYLDSRGIATITSSTIHITEAKSIPGIVEDNKKPYSDIKILVQGVTADNPLNVRDINGTKAVIDKDGVYEFKDNGLYLGFGFSKVGVVDVTITQLPTSILKDLSGNGNHAYLYGCKGKLNSGMGVYQEDFTTWSKIQGIYELGANSFNWKYSNDTNTTILTKGANETKSMKVIIEGLSTNILQYAYYEESVRKILEIKQDGEYVLPFSESNSSQTWNGFAIIKNEETVDITITQIPDYPNQLCYDGKMYAVCYGFPILTDYTVMAERTWFDKTGVRCFCSKYKDNTAAALFKFEWVTGNKEYTSSLGKDTDVVFVDSNITWQTKTSYNGKALTNLQYEDGEHLIIGDCAEKIGNYYIGCHSDFLLFNRTLTQEEIDWVKNKIFQDTNN